MTSSEPTTQQRSAPACACGHDPAAHDAPAGPCHLCGPADAHHPYTPEENP